MRSGDTGRPQLWRAVGMVLLIAAFVLPAAALITNFSWRAMALVMLGWVLIVGGLILKHAGK